MTLLLNSGSPEETLSLGTALGSILEGDELVFLSGSLGAGKTMFAKGIGNALGIEEREIVSPSYTLMNIYEGKFKLFHIDLYRIGEHVSGGIPEIDDNLDTGIIVVEWADYIREFYCEERRLLNLFIGTTGTGNRGRKISISTEIHIPPGTFSGY